MIKRLWEYLTDFSAADRNREEVAIILAAALRESADDAGFDAKLREVLSAWEGTDGWHRYVGFRRFLSRCAPGPRFGERPDGLRAQAERVLQDLPRIYGQKGPQPGR
jgi:hypothetical protein